MMRLRTRRWGMFWLLIMLIGVPATVAFERARDPLVRLGLFAAVSAAILLSLEILFRVAYRLYSGEAYAPVERLAFENLYVEPHPYIPFIYKRNFQTDKRRAADYALHPGRFEFGQYRTNALGFANGPNGDREIEVPKPDGLFRVNCIGASATGNYIDLDGRSFSYPLELEALLKERLDISVEVNNCAQGGYNSADLFVRFALQVIDTQPTVVVIYHGYNDVRDYFTAPFASDYSHSRRNLGENYWKFALAAHVPDIPLKVMNFLINQWLPVSIRYSLMDQVSRGKFDPDLDPSAGLRTYRRNLQHIIDLCRCSGIKVVLSTYCHFLHDAIRDEPVHQLYGSIVSRENEIVRQLAAHNGVPLVDNAQLIAREERLFVDSIHFTPEGMRLVAGNIADAIVRLARGTQE